MMMNGDDGTYEEWAGLVEVSQKPGVDVLGVGRGAHVTVLAWCRSAQEFRTVVEEALKSNGLKLVDAEDIETCKVRMGEHSVPDKFVSALNTVGPDNRVTFMEFHTFPVD